ncbi:MDR family MFS transporter [Falsibacillus albus]|uniref:MFS transporter n=1 Tax=Falsibacillus albus TaxID=2478915 RepID=A0A3L7JUW7_9BACI|nr:MFS transporter [Falsibacillus albus]RLQ94657.1 MFS transporter [Falsibacillus albus]
MRIRDWDRNLKVRLFGEALLNLTFWMFFPFLTIYFTEAFGKEKAGILLIGSQVFSVLANLLGGYYADRYGRKKMMVLSAFGQGVAFLVFGFANSPWLESATLGFICFTFAGMCGSVYWPASQAMVADVVDEKERSNVFAVFYTSINIAVVLGPMLGGIFYVHYRFQLLAVSGLVCMLLAFMLFKWTRETAPLLVNNDGAEAIQKLKWHEALWNQVKDYRVIIRDKTFLLFIIAGVLAAQTFMQLDLLIPVYIKETIKEAPLLHFGDWSLNLRSEQIFGFVLSENGLLVALFTVFVTKWMTKYYERNVFMISSIVYGLAIFMMGQFGTVWGMIIAMAFFTFAELMTVGIQQSFISKLAPEHMRGQYFAAASLRFTIGRTLAPLSIPLTTLFGYEWTFLSLTFLAVLSAAIYWLMFRRFEKDKTETASAQ